MLYKIRKRCMIKHSPRIARNGVMINIKFWTTLKPLLKIKRIVKLTEILQKDYINVVENTTGKRPVSILELNNISFLL